MKSLAAGIAKAGSTDTEKLVDAFRGLKVDGPFGPFDFPRQRSSGDARRLRRQDRAKDGHGTMADFKYVDGASVPAVRRRGEEAAPGGGSIGRSRAAALRRERLVQVSDTPRRELFCRPPCAESLGRKRFIKTHAGRGEIISQLHRLNQQAFRKTRLDSAGRLPSSFRAAAIGLSAIGTLDLGA